MNLAKNRTHGNSERSVWLTQICYLASRPAHESNTGDSNRKRILLMLESHDAITVTMVMKALGLPDITVRRLLDEMTPGFARATPGRPKKWRKA